MAADGHGVPEAFWTVLRTSIHLGEDPTSPWDHSKGLPNSRRERTWKTSRLLKERIRFKTNLILDRRKADSASGFSK